MDDIVIRRIYLPPTADDGVRVLVDRLWPRGVGKADAALDLWARDVAPSPALRQWFGHDPARWNEFRRRYRAELDAAPAAVAQLRALRAPGRRLTLLYAARDEQHNHARVLCEYLLAQPG